MLRSGNNASNLCSYSLNYVLLLFTDDVMHMPHFTRAPYHTLYIPNSTIPHAHPHPLSQPPKRDMTHSSHNMAQLPFLYAVVQIHAQRCMHKDTCTQFYYHSRQSRMRKAEVRAPPHHRRLTVSVRLC